MRTRRPAIDAICMPMVMAMMDAPKISATEASLLRLRSLKVDTPPLSAVEPTAKGASSSDLGRLSSGAPGIAFVSTTRPREPGTSSQKTGEGEEDKCGDLTLASVLDQDRDEERDRRRESRGKHGIENPRHDLLPAEGVLFLVGP